MSSPEAPASSPPSEQRQPRQSRLVKASLGCERRGRFDVTIRNVSETGIGGQSPQMLNIGERLTLYLSGHSPMEGTVRWVVGKRFGMETDRPIEILRLRAAHADQIVAADSSYEFQIVPAPQFDTWRPGLRKTSPLPGHYGRKR